MKYEYKNMKNKNVKLVTTEKVNQSTNICNRKRIIRQVYCTIFHFHQLPDILTPSLSMSLSILELFKYCVFVIKQLITHFPAQYITLNKNLSFFFGGGRGRPLASPLEVSPRD